MTTDPGMSETGEQPVQSRTIGPGDNDYGRTPGWHPLNGQFAAPTSDDYEAGPCPKCGEFAIGAERHPDGLVHCRNNHKFKRGASAIIHGVDPAKPGCDISAAVLNIGFTITIKSTPEGPGKCALHVTDDTGHTHMLANLGAFPTGAELAEIVKGLRSAAAAGIHNIDFKLRNPVAADLVDRFFKRVR